MQHPASIADLWSVIDAGISQSTERPFLSETHLPLGGGCINATYRFAGGGMDYFVKINIPAREAMFAAEAAGLQEIRDSHAIQAPAPICHGATEQASYLVLEFLDLAPCRETTGEQLGRQLAGMHAHTAAQFGWRIDNTIGSTPQSNTPHPDWISFWREERLEYQLRLASQNGIDGKLKKNGACLLDRIEQFFPGYAPLPALLHGDLWNGNCAALAHGEPVIFDPAVYYGDRETDLAMSELFGGFSPRFYAAYGEVYPIDPGYKIRKILYNLYHILNHANLFGGSYVEQASRMLEQLLSEVR
ncbi:MAG: fructosamine kinase family protein [Sulfuricella denitrificans]|nr:fructosamine kinase family protein [Sulfuricella denitrificans]